MDGLTLYALVRQWNAHLSQAKIEKIHQPNERDLVFTLRGRQGTVRMLISANRGGPRMHLIALQRPENPAVPPMFCVMLRKRLEGGRVLGFRQQGWDRAVEILIEHIDELGDLARYVLVVEMMGKHSNIILCQASDEGQPTRVVDSIVHVSAEMSRVRRMGPGVSYTKAPPQPKQAATELTMDTFANVAWGTLTEKEQQLTIIRRVDGFGPISAREVLHRAGATRDVVSVVQDLVVGIQTDRESASIGLDDLGRTVSAAPFALTSFADYRRTDSLDEALETVHLEVAKSDHRSQLATEIEQNIGQHLDRLRGKLYRIQALQADSTEHDQLRVIGELLTAYVSAVPKGASVVSLPNFYDEEKQIDIPLDASQSAIENAQRYFKQSSKRKRSIAILAAERAETEADMHYLEAVRTHVASAATDNLQQIRAELTQQGFMKSSPSKRGHKLAEAPAAPDEYASDDGLVIRVGRNNLQNDRLTLKLSKGHDVWLHVKDGPGSHVVIRSEGRTVPETTLHQAAILAAYFSKSRDSSNVQVDYTEVKHVWKANGARPGQVLYEGHRTLFVSPTRGDVDRLLGRKK